MEKKYCRDCVMSCYKDGLQVKEENCTENPEECSFKHEHIDYSNLKVNK